MHFVCGICEMHEEIRADSSGYPSAERLKMGRSPGMELVTDGGR